MDGYGGASKFNVPADTQAGNFDVHSLYPRNPGDVSQRAPVFLDSNESIFSKMGGELGAVGEIPNGAVNSGIERFNDRPWQSGAEFAGAAAVVWAMRGPTWARLPATAVAFAGTLGFINQVSEAASNAGMAISEAWECDRNMPEDERVIREIWAPLPLTS